MRDRIRKVLRIGIRIFAGCMIFLALYTVYCLIAVPELCDLAEHNPKTTAFQELRRKQWKEKKLNRKVVQYWVPLSAVSKNLRYAVLSAEDPNFYKHHGLDFYQIWLSMQENWEEKRIVRGASTITQQLMKNLYLSPSQNPLRKWKEAILALRVERCVKKDRLLEIYLNVIEWGESTYGIEAASRRYFGKPAASLGIAESALLAAMIPNPVARNPYKPSATLLRKKAVILKLMYRGGKITSREYTGALNEKIKLR